MNPKEYGYDDKESLVKDHWRRYGSRANWIWQDHPRLEVMVRHREYPNMPVIAIGEISAEPAAQTFDKITFSLRPAKWLDRVIHQVVCDDIVCAEG